MKEVYEWFSRERGIRRDTLDALGVEVETTGDIKFRYPSGLRYRSNPLSVSDRRRFTWQRGTGVSLFNSDKVGKYAFLVEGETDTLRLHQEVADHVVDPERRPTIVGLPGIETWKDHFTDQFKGAEKVWVVLDNDEDYNTKDRVDQAWLKIRRALGPRAKRIVLPSGTKDLCEFFKTYTYADLRTLMQRRAKSNFQPLDFSQPPGPMDWLAEGLICKNDVTLLVGDPGLGKSWLTLSLAVGVIEGWSTWLGHKLNHHGRVLYIDEENPEDIIKHRMSKLGLRNYANIRYLHRNGIWLDKNAAELLDEASEWAPELIVIDALAMVHTGDENSASSMVQLFREGIVPLSRETGAAVVVIHHSNKSETSSSFVRTRGSGGISGVVDAAIDVRPVAGGMSLSMFKSRRVRGGNVIHVAIKDMDDGSVRLDAREPTGQDIDWM